MKRLRYILFLFIGMMLAACADTIEIGEEGITGSDGKGTGELVLFSAGRTNNQMMTRADGDGDNSYTETPGETYYMGTASRFVCRMYYIADNASETDFDLSERTKTITWFVVDGQKAGNSLYWNKYYSDPEVILDPAEKTDQSKFDAYGNDKTATFFYWQNRKNHAFLAWTDLNKATSNDLKYNSTKAGYNLKLDPEDMKYEEHTGRMELHYVFSGLKMVGNNSVVKPIITDILGEAIKDYDNVSQSEAQTSVVNNMPITDYTTTYTTGWDSIRFYYKSGEVDRHDEVKDENEHTIKYNYGPYVYYVWSKDQKKDDGTYDYTQKPKYTVALYRYFEEKESEIINEYSVNKFDLTHKSGDGKNSIADQPDPCQALTIMKPMGATQAANRVNLYFKHQFSQVQVNVKSSSDNSVDIKAEQIKKIELLGVTEEGYIFTELSTKLGVDNKTEYYVHPAAYKDVDVSKYTDTQLEVNPYGTSLELFDMGSDKYAPGYLKSFNGITFGLLKAIRVTWQETAANGQQTHVSTFKVTDTNLNTLKSGLKYIWNIELRRGTLAVITTTIDDWIVPTGTLNYTADGTIQN